MLGGVQVDLLQNCGVLGHESWLPSFGYASLDPLWFQCFSGLLQFQYHTVMVSSLLALCFAQYIPVTIFPL